MSLTRRSRTILLAVGALVAVTAVALVLALTRTPGAASDAAAPATTPHAPQGEPRMVQGEPRTALGALTDRFVVTYGEDSEAARALEQVQAFGTDVLDLLPPQQRQALTAAAQEVSVTIESATAHAGSVVAVALSGALTEEQIAEFTSLLEGSHGIEAVDPELRMTTLAARMPDDEYFPLQWHMSDRSHGMDAAGAWSSATGAGVTVAVIDSGILLDHPDLEGQLLPGYDFISDEWVSRDGDGRDELPADEGDYSAADECYQGSEEMVSSWHGSHVAGTIAASSDNGIGVAGVAPDAQILPVRALGRCGGLGTDAIDALTWASGGRVNGVPDNPYPADVINMSLGGNGSCPVYYQRAIDAAVERGSIIVAAAGNEDQDVAGVTPAGCDNVITVGATGPDGNRAPYSNYGADVDVSAPGGDVQDVDAVQDQAVLSIMDASSTTPQGGTYGFMQGTSQAAPHVAGTIALLMELDPGLGSERAVSLLQDTTAPLSSCDRGSCGTGIISASAAVEAMGDDGGERRDDGGEKRREDEGDARRDEPGRKSPGKLLRPPASQQPEPDETRRTRSGRR